jgi:hypothetical protein
MTAMFIIIIAAEGSTPNLDPVFRADLCTGEIEIEILCLSTGGQFVDADQK